MINKGIIENNKKRIRLNLQYKDLYLKYKEMRKQAYIDQNWDKAFEICQLMDKLPKNSSKVRIRNRCSITGRARGLVCYKIFPICGIKLREHANLGHIPGVSKV